MTQYQTLTLVSLLALTVIVWFAAFLKYRLRMRVERYVLEEQTRAMFADARRQLEKLAREEKLSPNSETFKMLYLLQTHVLRRPDHLEKIANDWQKHLTSKDTETLPSAIASKLALESKTWPNELIEVITLTADAIDHLVEKHCVENVKATKIRGYSSNTTYMRAIAEALRSLTDQVLRTAKAAAESSSIGLKLQHES